MPALSSAPDDGEPPGEVLGHQGGGGAPALRHRASAALPRGARRGVLGRPQGPAVQGRAVLSHVPARSRRQELRAAPQAAGQVAALGTRGGPRVPGDDRAWRHGRAGAADLLPVYRRVGGRHDVLRHGARQGPGALGGVAAGHGTEGAVRDLRRAEPDARPAPRRRLRSRGALDLRQAGELLRAPDPPLDEAVPGLGDPATSRR